MCHGEAFTVCATMVNNHLAIRGAKAIRGEGIRWLNLRKLRQVGKEVSRSSIQHQMEGM